MKELEQFVSQVRNAFDNDSVRRAYIGFNEFPEGSCMDASILLGLLLHEFGLGSYRLVSAWDENKKSHSWLENDLNLIDITSEQFEFWPKQLHVINKELIPEHLKSFHIDRKEFPVEFEKVYDPGFYKALGLVKDIIMTEND